MADAAGDHVAVLRLLETSRELNERQRWYLAESIANEIGHHLEEDAALSEIEPAQGDARFPMNDSDRADILASAMRAINRATLNGDICDDVAWFDQIETLHDFCERILALTVRREPITAGGSKD